VKNQALERMNPEEEEFAAAAAAHISAHDRLGGCEESAEAHLTRTVSLRGGQRGGAHAGMVLRVRELSTALPAAAGHDLGSGGGDMAFSGVHTWPSAVALGEMALSSERSLRGRHVVEVGAGTGVPSLAAAAWAAKVVFTDRAQVHLYAPLPADARWAAGQRRGASLGRIPAPLRSPVTRRDPLSGGASGSVSHPETPYLQP